jgi:hypothetical protein
VSESAAIPIAVVATITLNTLFIFLKSPSSAMKNHRCPNTKAQCQAYFLSRLLRLARRSACVSPRVGQRLSHRIRGMGKRRHSTIESRCARSTSRCWKDQRHRSRACRPSSYAPSFILPSGPMILCSRTWWEGASSLSTRRLHDLVPNCELFTSDN